MLSASLNVSAAFVRAATSAPTFIRNTTTASGTTSANYSTDTEFFSTGEFSIFSATTAASNDNDYSANFTENSNSSSVAVFSAAKTAAAENLEQEKQFQNQLQSSVSAAVSWTVPASLSTTYSSPSFYTTTAENLTTITFPDASSHRFVASTHESVFSFNRSSKSLNFGEDSFDHFQADIRNNSSSSNNILSSNFSISEQFFFDNFNQSASSIPFQSVVKKSQHQQGSEDMNLLKHILCVLNETQCFSGHHQVESGDHIYDSPSSGQSWLDSFNSTSSSYIITDNLTINGSVDQQWTVVTEEPFRDVFLWVYGLLIVVIAIVGIFGNMASLVILTRPIMRNSINTYLAALSGFDCFLLVMVLLIYPPLAYCTAEAKPDATPCTYISYTLFITYPLSLIAQTGSVWICVAITMDRYIAVCLPLKSRSICTLTRAQIVSASTALFAVLYNVPTFFEVKISPDGTVEPSNLRKSAIYREGYKTYSYLLVMILLPVLAMIVLNAFVTSAIHKASASRKQMSGREEKERRTTVMVIVVVGAFLLLNLVAFLNNFIEAFGTQPVKAHLTWVMVPLGNLLVAVNSAINFVIYCAMGVRFRQMFIKIFLPKCCYDSEAAEYTHLTVRYGYNSSRRSNGGRSQRGKGSGEVYGIISMRKIPPPPKCKPKPVLESPPPSELALPPKTAGNGAEPVQKSLSLPFGFSPLLRQSQRRKLLDSREQE